MKAVGALFLLVGITYGQGGRSTILGSVTDESGTAVPNVSPTVMNTGTQQKRATTADGAGNVPATRRRSL